MSKPESGQKRLGYLDRRKCLYGHFFCDGWMSLPGNGHLACKGHLEACKSLIVRVRMLKVLRASNLFILKKWDCGGQQILEGVLEYSVERRIWVVAIH